MKECHDTERSLQRLSLNKGGPRDLSAIALTLQQLPDIIRQLSQGIHNRPQPYAVIEKQVEKLRSLHERLYPLEEQLQSAVNENPPLMLHSGSFVKPGYSKPLDQVQTLQKESQEIIGRLQNKYRTFLETNNVKLKSNLTRGLHIELPSSQHTRVQEFNAKIQSKGTSIPEPSEENDPLSMEALMSSEPTNYHLFMHCQTMPNAMRYKTEELSLLDQRIQRAEYEIRDHEEQIFRSLSNSVLDYASDIRTVAALLAAIDVNSSLGQLAALNDFCRPVLTEANIIDIRGGRHPVVESVQQSRQQGGDFTPNDLVMSEKEDRLLLLTGPNMGGKSTFLRQVGIQVILAQSGCFVPAASATIGIFDRIFSRVGAADDVKNDQSTFMMEMQEAAHILRMATSRSLVIVDELGRGTSTREGLAIAWAVLEQLHNAIRCRSIFATHYHELAQLSKSLPALRCCQMQIMETKSGVIAFLHKVIEGVASKSYGIHVAQLAGLPPAVIQRAEHILEKDSDLADMPAVQAETNLASHFTTSSVSSTEDEDAYYIRIDKKLGNFPDAYELLLDLTMQPNKKE